MRNQLDHLKVALAVLAAAGALSYAQAEAKRDSGAGSAKEAPKSELKVSERELHNDVTDANKASKIIGREVKNRENEHIGQVKDIVIDVATGKVAYAVLSTGHFGSGKLIAVPLDALTPQPGEKNFVMDAPKARVEAAQGFADNHWPSLDAGGDRSIGLSGATTETKAQDATAPSTTDEKKKP